MSDPLNLDKTAKSVDDLSVKAKQMVVNGVSNTIEDFSRKVEKLADPEAMNKEIDKLENGMKTIGNMFKSFLK